MNGIWFLSKKRNLIISGFNRSEREVDGEIVTELWVTERTGSSQKIATGKQAIEMEQTLLDMIWQNYPSIISDGNGSFGTNVKLRESSEGAE